MLDVSFQDMSNCATGVDLMTEISIINFLIGNDNDIQSQTT